MFGKIVKVGVVLVFLSIELFAGKIDRAYEALSVYDYFKAKSLFEELLDKEPVAANYGLGIIMYRNDNPFHNLDQAYIHVGDAERNFKSVSDGDKEDLLELSIDSVSIFKLKNDIVLEYWKKINGKKDIEELNLFIEEYPFYIDINDVIMYRDSIAFERADSIATFQSYREYYTSYPESSRAGEAKREYEGMLYDEKTSDGLIHSFIDFITIYPENSFVLDAQKEVYELSTTTYTIESYKKFINKFPKSPYVSEAWKNLFALSFTDFSDEEFNDFTKNNSNFPYTEMLEEARELRNLELMKVVVNGKWGYVKVIGRMQVFPKYAFENEFHNGLALVANDDYVGYINKKGEQVVEFKYDDGSDFHEGLAYVSRDDSVAMINKLGSEILGFNFSYISKSTEGIILARKISDEKYVYYNKEGVLLFDGKDFDYAEEFVDGFAIVSLDEKYGVIDTSGNFVLSLVYKNIISGKNNKYKAMNDDNHYGLISLTERDTIIPFKYAYIGEAGEDKYSVFAKSKYGFRRGDGSVIVESAFNRFEGDTVKVAYKNGYSVTEFRNKYGLVDSLGQKVFPNIFDAVGEAIDFPIPASKRGKWGYVTSQVTLWCPYMYDEAGAFKDGLAIVSKDGKYGVIDMDKKNVIEFKYDFLLDYDEDYLIAKEGEFYGLIDKKGTEILPFFYSKIEKYKGDIIRLYLSGEYHYFDLTDKNFIYGWMPIIEEDIEQDSIK